MDKGKGKGGGFNDVNESERNFEAMLAMLAVFRDTGAHYSQALRAQFPLFEGPAPLGHPYPEAFGTLKGKGKGFVAFGGKARKLGGGA